MSEGRTRNTSLEIIQAKADSIRALDLSDVDADLSGLTPEDRSEMVERSPEDDEAIASVIREVEQEMQKESSSLPDFMTLMVVMVAVIGGLWYLRGK